MTREELLNRLKNYEDNFVERKKAANAQEIRKTLVAFANSVPEGREAILYIGVTNDGKEEGVSSPDSLQKTIRDTVKQDCYPPVNYSVEVFQVSGKNIVAVIVGASDERPHFSGPAFVRVGSESVKATKEMYEELIASRNSKAAKILRNKGSIVSVATKKLRGNPKSPRDSGYYKEHECRIEGCDAHVAHLFDLYSSRYISEPIERVTISYDQKKQRMMLEVE